MLVPYLSIPLRLQLSKWSQTQVPVPRQLSPSRPSRYHPYHAYSQTHLPVQPPFEARTGHPTFGSQNDQAICDWDIINSCLPEPTISGPSTLSARTYTAYSAPSMSMEQSWVPGSCTDDVLIYPTCQNNASDNFITPLQRMETPIYSAPALLTQSLMEPLRGATGTLGHMPIPSPLTSIRSLLQHDHRPVSLYCHQISLAQIQCQTSFSGCQTQVSSPAGCWPILISCLSPRQTDTCSVDPIRHLLRSSNILDASP